jgi:hypothetical protein
MVKKLFDTVPEKYITVVAVIEQFFDLKKVAFEEAVGRLKAFEERIQRGAGGSKGDGGQLLLTQVEWEAQQKKSGGENSGKGRSQDRGVEVVAEVATGMAVAVVGVERRQIGKAGPSVTKAI